MLLRDKLFYDARCARSFKILLLIFYALLIQRINQFPHYINHPSYFLHPPFLFFFNPTFSNMKPRIIKCRRFQQYLPPFFLLLIKHFLHDTVLLQLVIILLEEGAASKCDPFELIFILFKCDCSFSFYVFHDFISLTFKLF